MELTQVAKEYCIGCGLCMSEAGVPCCKDSNGFTKIVEPIDCKQSDFIEKVCPVIGCNYSDSGESIWGDNVGIFSGFSTNNDIRRTASSGGVITALAMYLLETKRVDAVIQVKANSQNPIETVAVVCRSRDEVMKCCGSRYSISSPWVNISKLVDSDERYMAVGKPCDIAALRNAQNNLGLFNNIIYLVSFFCAGMPSEKANRNLLRALNCNAESVDSLTYRGNGWPGFTTAYDKNNQKHTMEYSKSWGGILGRDVHKYCRICIDGIGIAADVACGDGWYIKDNQPDFTEHEGRNVVIARNSEGLALLSDAQSAGYLQLVDWNDTSELEVIQKYQYSRRTTMSAKLLALKLMGRKVPKYNASILKKYSKKASAKEKWRMFGGIVKRVLKGKI